MTSPPTRSGVCPSLRDEILAVLLQTPRTAREVAEVIGRPRPPGQPALRALARMGLLSAIPDAPPGLGAGRGRPHVRYAARPA